jgi:hypothetical protein
MMDEELRQHRIAWIPWVLALVALLGANALIRDDCSTRRNDTDDTVGISVAAKDLGSLGRASDPMILGPSAPIDTVCHDPGSKFVKLETGKDSKPASSRHGASRGRAPPLDA